MSTRGRLRLMGPSDDGTRAMTRCFLRAFPVVLASFASATLLAACGGPTPLAGLRGGHSWSSIDLTHISCPALGACVAVGTRQSGGTSQPVVVEQSGDSWGAPIALNAPAQTGNGPDQTEIACSSRTDCVVDGWDGSWSTSGKADSDFFSESNGRWMTDRLAIPHSALLTGHMPGCSLEGDCWVVVGRIADIGDSSTIWTYVLGVTGGGWTNPIRIGVPSSLPTGWHLFTVIGYVISCSAESCTTVGQAGETTSKGTPTPSQQSSSLVFAQTEKSGDWGNATVLPADWKRPASSFRIGIPGPQPLDCFGPGDCLIAGSEGALQQGAIAQLNGGMWQTPTPHIGVVGKYIDTSVSAVACDTAALCIAAGDTGVPSGKSNYPFAQVRVAGRWLSPTLLTGLGPDADKGSWVTGAICPTATTCYVVGQLGGKRQYSFVARYRNATWSSSVVTWDGRSAGVLISTPSCSRAVCWVAGELEASAGSPTSGIVFPLSSLRLSAH